jgi:hypothetical protein
LCLRDVVVYTSLILFITLFIFAALLTIKCRFHNTFSLKECMQILWNVTKYFVVGKFYHLITIIIHRDNIDSFQIYICWEWYLNCWTLIRCQLHLSQKYHSVEDIAKYILLIFLSAKSYPLFRWSINKSRCQHIFYTLAHVSWVKLAMTTTFFHFPFPYIL